MYYDTKFKKRQTEKHLKRRGLDEPGVNLNEIGIIPLIDSHDIDPDLYIVRDTGEVAIRDGHAHVVYDKTPKTGPEIRQKTKEKIHARRDSILISGIAFTFDGENHRLQTRSAVDLVNWMSTFTTAQTLPIDTPIKVRTEADKTLFIPSGQMLILLSHMVEYRTAIMDVSWTLKDAIDQAATDAEAITAYEDGIHTIWPDSGPKAI